MPTRALTIRLLFSFSENFSFFIGALAIGQILTIITFIFVDTISINLYLSDMTLPPLPSF